ncbi:hypothetical protein BC830DRAFT_1090210 [Chytriomyces sp. MP71]|nr:hypothetical protein BC830DRAFT_1090210 [Chytriomyces sp. MP71]
MSSVQVYVRVRPINSREAREGRSCAAVRTSGSTVTVFAAGMACAPSAGSEMDSNNDRERDRDIRERERGDRPFVVLPSSFAYATPGPSATFARTSNSIPLASFTFDNAFSGDVDQQSLYECVGVPLEEHALHGFNVCLFAYGQTGSGKTFSMMGTQEARGVIPLMCESLFRHIAANSTNTKFEVAVSYMEIYNEKVRDLLSINLPKPQLRVREHPTLGPYVEDLSRLVVTGNQQIERLIDLGNKARSTASTQMNETSSRSHAVFTIYLTQKISRLLSSGLVERTSRICLVDLAGSERADSTGATGMRLKEGANINKSLTTLGKVIASLAEASEAASPSNSGGGPLAPASESGSTLTKRTSNRNLKANSERAGVHIPYRDSILTWVLKDCLGGNSKTVMLATVSPSEFSVDETLSTLRYAERAKKIVNRAVVNEEESGKALRLLEEEVTRLRKKLMAYEQLQTVGPVTGAEGCVSINSSTLQSNLSFRQGVAVSPQLQENQSLNRRLSVYSIASGTSDVKDQDALIDQLVASEKLIAELTESFESRLNKSKLVEHLRTEALKEFGIETRSSTSGAHGFHAPKSTPHLLNLTKSSSLECLLYQLPVGCHTVGADPESAIQLDEESILLLHASFDCLTSSPPNSSLVACTVYLNPAPKSHTFVNGILISESKCLHTGDFVQFGNLIVFRFVNPTESHSQPSASPVSRDGRDIWSDLRSSISKDSRSHNSVDVSPRTSPWRLNSAFLNLPRVATPGNRHDQNDMGFSVKDRIESSGGESREKRSRPASVRIFMQPLNDKEMFLASRVVQRWKSRNYVKLARQVLQKAVTLKEANVIAKELGKDVLYEFEILESIAELHVISFWDTSAETNTNSGVIRSRQSSAQIFGLDAHKPCLVVRVYDGKHNCIYRWSLQEFENRLNSMRTLYDYPDPDAPSKYYAQRAATSELSFYNGGPNSGPRPHFERIGSCSVDIRNLTMSILKELRAPVICRESGSVLGWLLVVLAPISAQPSVLDSDSSLDLDNANDMLTLSHDELKLGHSLVFEISILELTGLSEEDFSQVHCQFRLSQFTGGTAFAITNEGLLQFSGMRDQLYATDPVQGFKNSPVRWDFSQTIAVTVTNDVKSVLSRGLAVIEVFARRQKPISAVIEEKFLAHATRVAEPASPASPTHSGSNKDPKEHVILAQIEISELSQVSGDFKPVPVETSVQQSGILKTEFRSPADVFFIRQGIQRRISLRLNHSAGKNEFPWRRISYVRIGQIRRVDLRTNRPLDDEFCSPAMISLPITGLDEGHEEAFKEPLLNAAGVLHNRPFFSGNGQSSLELVVPWDTSLHNCIYLNRANKGFRLELTVAWGVDMEPLNNHPVNASQWSLFASAVHFERQFGIVVHERDSKVKVSTRALDILSTIGFGTAKYSSRSNSLFIVETFPVSSSLVPKPSTNVRSRMSDIDTRKRYVRGEESLGNWSPSGQELVIKFWKRKSRERLLEELSLARSRNEEHEMFWNGGDRLKEKSGASIDSSQGGLLLLAKCVQIWRMNSRRWEPCLESLLFDQSQRNDKRDDEEEVNFVSAKSRLKLEMAPVSFKGHLLTPNDADVWVRRYFVVRRPFLHMFAEASDLDELAIFSLINASAQFGPSLESIFQGKHFVFALHSKDCSLLLQAQSVTEMHEWLAMLDPLETGAALSRTQTAALL